MCNVVKKFCVKKATKRPEYQNKYLENIKTKIKSVKSAQKRSKKPENKNCVELFSQTTQSAKPI